MNYEFQGINETNTWIALATVSVLLSTVILFLMAALTVVTLQYWKLQIRTKSTNEDIHIGVLVAKEDILFLFPVTLQ